MDDTPAYDSASLGIEPVSASKARRLALALLASGDRALAPAGAAAYRGSLEQEQEDRQSRRQAAGFAQQSDLEARREAARERFQSADNESRDKRNATASNSAMDRVLAAIGGRDRAAQAAADKADRVRAEREAQWLAKQYATNGLAELQQSRDDLDTAIKPYADAGEDIPGIGGLSSIGAIANMSSEGKQIHAKYAAVRNNILKARSGGAVTESEAARLLNELGDSVMFSSKDFLTNWQSVKNRIDAMGSNLESGVSPEAVDLYHSRRQGAPRPRTSPGMAVAGSAPTGGGPSSGGGPVYQRVNGKLVQVQ